MNIKIAPSILSADFSELGAGVEAISTADYVHFDVMDGCFVPNISIGIPVLQSIRKRTALPIDVHLMIVQPERYVDQFCDAGADLVTCHVEADTPEKISLALDKIHAKGKKAGVVLKPNTRAEAVHPPRCRSCTSQRPHRRRPQARSRGSAHRCSGGWRRPWASCRP